MSKLLCLRAGHPRCEEQNLSPGETALTTAVVYGARQRSDTSRAIPSFVR